MKRERKQAFLEHRRARPTLAELREQAEEALRAEHGKDLGKLSREERNKILFCECLTWPKIS